MNIDAAVAALVGAALGALGSVGGVWLTQRHQTKRDLLKAAVDLGQAERQERLERVAKTGGPVLPVSVYVAHHAAILQAIANNKFGAETISRIDDDQIKLVKQIHARKVFGAEELTGG